MMSTYQDNKQDQVHTIIAIEDRLSTTFCRQPLKPLGRLCNGADSAFNAEEPYHKLSREKRNFLRFANSRNASMPPVRSPSSVVFWHHDCYFRKSDREDSITSSCRNWRTLCI
jgi:hypothetical protein